MFFNLKEGRDWYLAKISLITSKKKAIGRQWCKSDPAKKEQWFEENVFDSKWEKWIIYMKHDADLTPDLNLTCGPLLHVISPLSLSLPNIFN